MTSARGRAAHTGTCSGAAMPSRPLSESPWLLPSRGFTERWRKPPGNCAQPPCGQLGVGTTATAAPWRDPDCCARSLCCRIPVVGFTRPVRVNLDRNKSGLRGEGAQGMNGGLPLRKYQGLGVSGEYQGSDLWRKNKKNTRHGSGTDSDVRVLVFGACRCTDPLRAFARNYRKSKPYRQRGRVAQRESTTLTRWGSEVRSLSRPYEILGLGAGSARADMARKRRAKPELLRRVRQDRDNGKRP